MTDDLSALPQPMREAVEIMDLGNRIGASLGGETWGTVRAGLLRLASENVRLHEANIGLYARMEHLERAEVELAELKARIAAACLVPVTRVCLGNGYGLTVSASMSINDVYELHGKRVRLVVED